MAGPSDTLPQHLRRLIERTTPGRPPQAAKGERRLVSRYGRVLPVLLVPLDDGRPSIEEAGFMICQDLSDRGMSIIQNRRLEYSEVVVGIWHTCEEESPYAHEPFFVSGTIKSNKPMGGGFWRSGIVFDAMFADPIYLSGLQVLAKGLIPIPRLSVEDRELVLGGS